MASNNISQLPKKQDRQIAKLNIAAAKRQGKTVARDGTISGTLSTVANTTTVTSAVNGQSLTMSANASSTNPQAQYTLTLGNPGTMYNNAPIVQPNGRQQVYVGVGNKLTVTCSATFTVREIGTTSSATAGN